MDLGFNKSKANSNLFFKVEGKIPMMVLLYKDTCCQVQDEGIGYDALLYRHGGVENSP